MTVLRGKNQEQICEGLRAEMCVFDMPSREANCFVLL